MRSQAFHAELRAGSAPAWVKSLGPVPTRRRAFRQWVRAAGEADTLRKKYKVPESEPAVLPDQMVHEARQRVNNTRLASEGAPGPEADEETLAVLRVSQIGMRAYARKGAAPHPKQPPAPSTVRPKTHKGMEL